MVHNNVKECGTCNKDGASKDSSTASSTTTKTGLFNAMFSGMNSRSVKAVDEPTCGSCHKKECDCDCRIPEAVLDRIAIKIFTPAARVYPASEVRDLEDCFHDLNVCAIKITPANAEQVARTMDEFVSNMFSLCAEFDICPKKCDRNCEPGVEIKVCLPPLCASPTTNNFAPEGVIIPVVPESCHTFTCDNTWTAWEELVKFVTDYLLYVVGPVPAN